MMSVRSRCARRNAPSRVSSASQVRFRARMVRAGAFGIDRRWRAAVRRFEREVLIPACARKEWPIYVKSEQSHAFLEHWPRKADRRRRPAHPAPPARREVGSSWSDSFDANAPLRPAAS